MQLFDTSTAATVEPPFGDKHGKSRAPGKRRGRPASRAEVLTNTGRCSCPFVASGVLARYARRVEFLLLATRFEGSRRRRVPRLVRSRAKAAPSQTKQRRRSAKRGEALVSMAIAEHAGRWCAGGIDGRWARLLVSD